MKTFKNNLFYSNACERAMNIRGFFIYMKATIKTKNPYTYPTYTVMIGKEIIKAFYSKKDATEFKNKLNS